MAAVTSSPARIRLDAVRKEFVTPRTGERTMAVADLSLEVRAGEFLCLVGPSGCGKSTVLNMIAGLTPPTAGTITMDGQPIRGPGAERGVVFQDYALFPWKTVRENVEFGPRFRARGRLAATERSRRVQQCIDLVALTGVENKYPHELSGGRIWGEERTAAERRTVVFITHAIDEAVFLADRVVVMASLPGRIRRTIEIDLPRPRCGVPPPLRRHLAAHSPRSLRGNRRPRVNGAGSAENGS
jgi:NitT/TauT family transport system ATP-binding protein